MSKVVGDKIKSIRLKRGETLEGFGKLFNPPASKGVVSNWEKGYNLPNNIRLTQIAQLGNTTVDELLRTNVKSIGLNKSVGNKIKNIRLDLGETLEEFGKRFSPIANKALVSAWESGKHIPRFKRLKIIADLGSVSVDELLGNNCQLCSGQTFKASWYQWSGEDQELEAEYSISRDRKLIMPIDTQGKHIGFLEIDISYCPECGRKLEVKQ